MVSQRCALCAVACAVLGCLLLVTFGVYMQDADADAATIAAASERARLADADSASDVAADSARAKPGASRTVLDGQSMPPSALASSDSVPVNESILDRLQAYVDDPALPPMMVNTSMPLDVAQVFTLSSREQSRNFGSTYGRFPARCSSACSEECYRAGEAEEAALRDESRFRQWAWDQMTALVNETVDVWQRRGGITLDHHINMCSCSYRSRTHYNPSGVWLHIVGRTVTTLRMMVDGYMRHKRILQFIKRAVAESPEPLPPVVFYVSTVDFPCNPTFPYFTFFMRRGVLGFLIPDDTFEGSAHGANWSVTREFLLEKGSRVKYADKKPVALFKGSPTHFLRRDMELALGACCANNTDVTLAVIEKFKHLAVPLAEHAKYRYLLAIRGRVASNRDKYLMGLNSTVLWAQDSAPWFQFYQALWRPYVNYVPILPHTAACTMAMLTTNEYVRRRAEAIAANGRRTMEYLDQDRVDALLLFTIRRYATLQKYTVPEDPIHWLKMVNRLVRKRYRTAQLMPDCRHPVKFMFYEWLSRRWRQLAACRVNSSMTFSFHNQTGCWYT